MSYNDLKEEGNRHFYDQKYKEAIDCYTAALNAEPKSHVLYSNRSAAYCKLGRYEEALGDAIKCTTLSPGFSRGHLRRAVALNGLCRHREAMSAAEEGYKLRGSTKICSDCVSQWLAAAAAICCSKLEEMKKHDVTLSTGAAPVSEAYLDILFDIECHNSSTAGVNAETAKKWLLSIFREFDRILVNFGHSPSPCEMAWVDTLCLVSKSDPQSHRLPSETEEAIDAKSIEFASWLQHEIDPTLYPIICPLVFLALMPVLSRMYALRCVSMEREALKVLAKACLPLFEKSILSGERYIGLRLVIIGELLSSFTLESAFAKQNKEAEKLEIRKYSKQLEEGLKKYPTSDKDYAGVKRNSLEILENVQIILSQATSTGIPKQVTREDVGKVKAHVAMQHKVIGEKGKELNLRDMDSLVLSTGPLLHLGEVDQASATLQSSESLYFRVLMEQARGGLLTFNKLPEVCFHPQAMILANSLPFVRENARLVADAIVRWKCISSECHSLLTRLGAGKSFFDTYQAIQQMLTSKQHDIDPTAFAALADKHELELGRTLRNLGPEVLSALSKQSCEQICKALEPDQMVLDYSMAALYDTKCFPVPIPPKFVKLSGFLLALMPEGTPVVMEIDFDLLGTLSVKMHDLFMRAQAAKYAGKKSQHFEAEAEQAAREVAGVLFPAPIQALISASKVKRVFFCPEQLLAKLPVELLPFADGQRFGDKCAITYLSCARELLRELTISSIRSELGIEMPATNNSTECFIFANPNYDLQRQEHSPQSRWWDALTTSLSSFLLSSQGRTPEVSPLEQTEAEANTLESLLSNARNGTLYVHKLTGDDATVSRALQVNSPLLLHFSTHGKSTPDYHYQYSNFLSDKSALLLAGVNTFHQRKYDRISEAGTGELSALAICGMKLDGTRLVFLSACCTSSGAAGRGQSLNSLGQAFRIAGAHTIVAALWPISDVIGRKFATHFYNAVCNIGTHPSVALKYAKEKLKEEGHTYWYEWAPFMCIGYDLSLFPDSNDKCKLLPN